MKNSFVIFYPLYATVFLFSVLLILDRNKDEQESELLKIIDSCKLTDINEATYHIKNILCETN